MGYVLEVCVVLRGVTLFFQISALTLSVLFSKSFFRLIDKEILSKVSKLLNGVGISM